MGRRSVAAVVAVFIAPLAVGVMVNLFTPWLTTNAGAFGSVLTSPWLPWALYALTGVPWFYYWFVVVARRIAPQARLQRINDLFAEQEALRAAVLPDTSLVPPRGIERRVAQFRRNVGKVIGSDPAYREWLRACSLHDVIQADARVEGRWRTAIIALTNGSDEILRDLQLRLSPEGRQFPRRSRRDRPHPLPSRG